MALIYRSIFEVDDDGGFLDRVPGHVESWLRWKLKDSTLRINEPSPSRFDAHGIEIESQSGASEDCAATRVAIFEGRREDGLQVKTTLTAIREDATTWAWIDLERWTPDHGAAAWMPSPPGIVTTLLLHETARRRSILLARKAAELAGDQGELLSELILDPEREVPLVVVSYNEREDIGASRASERAREIARRVAGVASTYVLGTGAVTSFSRAMFEAVGDGMDVHSGAVRTYLPGVGAEWDEPRRHRIIPFHKIQGRRDDLAARMVAPPLFRRAAESPPPPVWRRSARSLLVRDGSRDDLEGLLVLADEEITELKDTEAGLRSAVAELRDALDAERDTNDELLRRNDDLSRRLSFLRRADPQVAEPEPHEEPFEPVLCAEVIVAVRERLPFVAIPHEVDPGAESLDAHGDESWAIRAWKAFQALNNYADLKAQGAFDGSFLMYCSASEGEFHIPVGWVAPTESAQTMKNPTFRALRTLPVDAAVDGSGRKLMQEHIRIERGGTPSPRIHYYDDTRGSTGKVHIGWFGDHLDSRAKS